MSPVRTIIARHRFLAGFVLLSVLMGLSVGVAKVTTSLYALDLGASPAQLGLIAGAQSIGILFMSLPVGVMVDRVGPKRVFIAGSVVAGLVYAAAPLIPSAAFLILCTALVSFCMPCRFISLNTVFMHQLERIGEAKAGWFRGTHMTGMFLLGPAIAVAIIAVLGYAGTYWLIALSFALTIAIAPLVLDGHPAATPRHFTFAELGRQLRLVGGERELSQTCAIEFAAQAASMYYSFFIVAIAIDSYGFTAGGAAALITVQGLLFVTALFTGGPLVGQLGQRGAYLTAFALIATALLSLGAARAPLPLWGGAVVLGLGLGLLQIVNLSRFARIGGRLGRGSVAGIIALTGPTGGLFGSVLGGLLSHRFGLQAVFLVLAPVFIVFGWRQFAGPRLAIAAADPA